MICRRSLSDSEYRTSRRQRAENGGSGSRYRPALNAATDTHLWGETYDRKLTDVFAAESDIARAIAKTLRAKLTGSEQNALAARPTENTEAHQLHLRGRYFWNKRTGADFKKAIGYFNQAITKTRTTRLPRRISRRLRFAFRLRRGGSKRIAAAKAAAAKALELDSTLGEAHASLGQAIFAYDQLRRRRLGNSGGRLN